METNTRRLLAAALLTAFAAAGNLIFVISKLPEVHWSSLAGGCLAGVIAAYAGLLLWTRRHRSRRPDEA